MQVCQQRVMQVCQQRVMQVLCIIYTLLITSVGG